MDVEEGALNRHLNWDLDDGEPIVKPTEYIISDNCNDGQDASLLLEMGNVG